MADEVTCADVMKRLVEGSGWTAVMMGGIGGVANFLLDEKAKKRDVMRFFMTGALISAGCGTAILALAVKFMGLPAETVPVGMAAGPASFMAGMFGPRLVQFMFNRLR